MHAGIMKRKSRILSILFMILLFEAACVYSSFDVVAEADFLSGNKFETRDVEEVYAEKQSSAEAILVSPALFTSLPGIILGILPSFSSPNTLFPQTFSILRC